MFGRKNGATAVVSDAVGNLSDAVGNLSPYAGRLAHDEKLRQRLGAAISAGAAARQRAKRQVGLPGLARRLGSDPVLRVQVAEAVAQLRHAKARAQKKRSHKTRNVVLFLTGAAVVVAAVPSLRAAAIKKVRGAGEDWPATDDSSNGFRGPTPSSVDEKIEVEAAVSRA
jgi:hypothetical protein